MQPRLLYGLIFFLLFASHSGIAQKASLKLSNQVSGWLGANFSDPFIWQTGARYIPTLTPSWQISEGNTIDAELSFNAYGNIMYSGFSADTLSYRLKPYRLWMRYSTNHLEIRAGLQKINFGSLNILRPLMWFDRIDYRDPLQLTDGVYGLLARYYFNNNTNIWLWTLYGNDNLKGWETVPSVKDIPEFGGRIQMPLLSGEMGMSYHHRTADYAGLIAQAPSLSPLPFSQDQLAIDGRWDIGAGLAFEFVEKINQKDNPFAARQERYFGVGIDYTFSIGNGLSLISEYFHFANKTTSGQENARYNFSSLSLSYPLFISDNLSGLIYYDWDRNEWYRFLNFQMKYDYLSIYLMAFWNPEKLSFYHGSDEKTIFAGKGIQLMLVLDI